MDYRTDQCKLKNNLYKLIKNYGEKYENDRQGSSYGMPKSRRDY